MTNSDDALAAVIDDLRKRMANVEKTVQMGSSTVSDDEDASTVEDIVTEAAVTADTLPDLQDDIADANTGVATLGEQIDAQMADLDVQLELAATNLDIAREEIEEAQAAVNAAFGTRVDGISEDVETAIVAAGSAKTEAEAATDAARDAAGLAASKGETIYQVSAPTGSRASTANLWIDITPDANGVPKNTPNRYVDLGPDIITNALPNPAFRNGLTGYSVEPAIAATQQADGSVRVITKDGQSQSFVIGGIQNAPYTLVVVGRSFQGGRPAIYGGNPQGQQVPLTDAWATYYVDITQTDTNGNLYLAVVSPGGEPTNGFDLRGLMLVPGTGYRGPYSDGTTAGWKWTGTADASASTYTGPKWVPVTDQKAIDAAAAASTATAAAQAAKDVAAQANAAAGVAQQTASDANAAALTAAGIANAKGKVIRQQSKPTGANAAVGNLWIRSSDNTPWVYDATAADWVQVTDQVAIDAAANAAKAQQDATAASNAAKAAQATADSKPLILYSSTAGPSGTAPNGTIWFLWDSAKNVAGQWLQSGTLAAPVWTPQQIRSEVIANLDVAKLTAGSAAIAELVAQKIAAATGNFQTVNVSNLFVTSGATMSQAVIDYLFANVVQAKKITAGMIDVDSLNGITLTGATIKSAASGQRAEIVSSQINFYTAKNALAGNISGVNYQWGGVDYPVVGIGGGGYGVLIGGGVPNWSGTTVGLRVNGDTSVKRLFLDPAAASDGYICGIYGFRKKSDSDATAVPMPLLYAKGNTSGSAYPDMFIENIKSVSASDFIGPDGASIVPLTGKVTYPGTLAANTSDTLTVTFPSGRFTKAPQVNANGSNSRVTIGINSVTKDAVTFALGNWTSGASGAPIIYYTATPTP